MTITRSQVRDLQPGDVVRVTGWQELTVEGPVSRSAASQSLWLGEYLRLSFEDPGVPLPNWMLAQAATLTVVSRAPRPLYANHPRTEPVPGDVARDELGNKLALFIFSGDDGESPYWLDTGAEWNSPGDMAGKRLRLLVDGENGQVVP